ncbi:SPOSA6832_02355, partial [Sporobolomyces salmonicolor]
MFGFGSKSAPASSSAPEQAPPAASEPPVKSVYRHGVPRDCSPKFEDFKFCMSVKGLSEQKREEVWVKRRAEWWARRREGRSSEDVWEARRNVYEDPAKDKQPAAAA